MEDWQEKTKMNASFKSGTGRFDYTMSKNPNIKIIQKALNQSADIPVKTLSSNFSWSPLRPMTYLDDD